MGPTAGWFRGDHVAQDLGSLSAIYQGGPESLLAESCLHPWTNRLHLLLDK